MSLRLAYNIDDQQLTERIQVPACCNVHGDIDYAYTKELIQEALRDAEIENASVLDRDNGYEVRLSDLYQRQLFMFYLEGDRHEESSFQIDTDEKEDVSDIIFYILDQLNIYHQAFVTKQQNGLTIHFRERSTFITAYPDLNNLRAKLNSSVKTKNTPAPT